MDEEVGGEDEEVEGDEDEEAEGDPEVDGVVDGEADDPFLEDALGGLVAAATSEAVVALVEVW